MQEFFYDWFYLIMVIKYSSEINLSKRLHDRFALSRKPLRPFVRHVSAIFQPYTKLTWNGDGWLYTKAHSRLQF